LQEFSLLCSGWHCHCRILRVNRTIVITLDLIAASQYNIQYSTR